MLNINLFPGSLFRGTFKLNIGSPLKSTRFGQLHPKYAGKPVKLTGYYKYIPGPVYQDRDKNPMAEKTDSCSIYAVMYKVTKGPSGRDEYLDGTNILDPANGRLIAKAVLQSSETVSNYASFELPFEYTEEPNYDLYDYKLAVVFSSSKNGDNYEGAIGSVLTIDDVEVVCEDY